MKYKFMRNNSGNDILILNFLGWSADEYFAETLTNNNADTLAIWDYRDMRFDYSILHCYKNIKIFAWSLGVFAAAYTFNGISDCICESIAVAGTKTPVSDTKGINTYIYDQTMNGLSKQSLQKFRIRMCGGRKSRDGFLNLFKNNDIETLRQELSNIKNMAYNYCNLDFQFTKVYLTENDKIFSFENQQKAWTNTKNKETVPSEHFNLALFQNIYSTL